MARNSPLDREYEQRGLLRMVKHYMNIGALNVETFQWGDQPCRGVLAAEVERLQAAMNARHGA